MVTQFRNPVQDKKAEELEKELGDILDDGKTSLGTFIEDAYDKARSARQALGIDADIEYCVCAYRDEYTADERQRLGITETNDVFAPLTSTKCAALISWLDDVFANAEDRPWTLEPTPYPDVPPAVEDQIIAIVRQEFQTVGDMADPEAVAARIRELKATLLPQAERTARKATERMEAVINDQLDQGGFRPAFAQFREDLAVYPNAFLRGPFIKYKSVPRWSGNQIIMETKPVLSVERVSPADVFPAPTATSTQDGAYIIERMFFSAADLKQLADLPTANSTGYNADSIMSLLKNYPNGYEYTSRRESLNLDISIDDTVQEDKTFEVIVYYGYVRREVLEDYMDGKLNTHSSAATDVVHVEVWVCAGYVLRVVEILEGLPRPLHSTSFRPEPGEFWGRSVPMVLRQVQRVANACIRSLVMNMAVSSAPIGEYDVDRLENEEELGTIEPWRMYAVVQRQTGYQPTTQPAIRFHKINSNAAELMDVYNRFEKMADDASGIPAYVIGAPQVAGAGRTLGGLALLMGNAAKGIKRIVGNMDKDVIEPLVTACYQINLRTTTDDSLKADAQVKARGAAGLLQRELSQARAVEVLQLLTPYAQAGLVPQKSIMYLLRDIVRSLGYPADEVIPDPDAGAELQRLVSQAVPGIQEPVTNAAPDVLAQLQGQGLTGAPEQPTLDQRSMPPANPADVARVPPA